MSGNRSKSAFFDGGWVTLSADFRGKRASSTKHCWCQKTRVIAVSCGIKISAVHHLVLSQYTHMPDRRTDRRTDRTDGQNSDSNTVRCITCSRTVKIKQFTADTTQKGNHHSFLTPTVVGRRHPFRLKFALKVTHPFEKRRLRQISAYSVSAVRGGEESLI